MATNHLIIGLGGTGGSIIREFRKRYFQEFGDLKPHKGITIEYLYLDSDVEKGLNGGGWRVLGQDISLSEAQKVNIQAEHGLRSIVLDNYTQYDELRSFLNASDIERLRSTSLIQGKQAGQRRKIGRLLFARGVNNNNGFRSKITSALRKLKETGKTSNTQFHIIAGLAGGTGSGTIVDVIAQLHSALGDDMGNKTISLYLYVPDLNHTGVGFDFYQANGYAALMELNAMAEKEYLPIDISATSDGRIAPLEDFFDVAYLFTDTNEREHVLEFREELPRMAASFLYYNLTDGSVERTSKSSDGGSQELGRLLTSENVEGNPEIRNGQKRTRRFVSFGIHRVEYPENEITEYLTYHHVEQAALALLNNDFTEDGFAEISATVSGNDLDTEVENAKHYLGLSEESLTLQAPSVVGEDSLKWILFREYWQSVSKGYSNDVMLDFDRSEWEDEYKNRINEHYQKGFRGVGVTTFFSNKVKFIPAYAENIADAIQNSLIDRWLNGKIGLIRVEKYLLHLSGECDKWSEEFQRKQNDLLYLKNGDGNVDSLYRQLDEAEDKFHDVGILGQLFENHKRKFQEFCDIDYEVKIADTEIEGLKFAVELLQKVRDRIAELIDNVHKLIIKVSDYRQMVLDEAAQRCVVNNSNSENTTKIFDAKGIQSLKDVTERDEESQTLFVKSIRQILKPLAKKGFPGVLNGFESIKPELETATTNHIREIVSELTNDRNITPVVDVNILSILKNELSNSEAIKDFAKQMIDAASCYVPFDSKESGRGGQVDVQRLFHLAIPRSKDENDTFRQELIEAIRGASDVEKDFSISDSPRSNEIVLLSAKSGFPARFIKNLSSLRKSYDRLINHAKEGADNMFLLHTEIRDYPALFDLNTEEIKKNALPFVICAIGMGILKEVVNPETEGKMFAARLGGLKSTPIECSSFKSLMETLGNNTEVTNKIISVIKEQITSLYKANSKKEVLRQDMENYVVSKILEECGGNEFSKEYQEIADSVESFINEYLKLS